MLSAFDVCTQPFLFLLTNSIFIFIIFYFLAAPRGMWNLSSPTRDGTRAPCSGSAVLTTGPPGKSRQTLFLNTHLRYHISGEAVPSPQHELDIACFVSSPLGTQCYCSSQHTTGPPLICLLPLIFTVPIPPGNPRIHSALPQGPWYFGTQFSSVLFLWFISSKSCLPIRP